jgi:hypothetical protein
MSQTKVAYHSKIYDHAAFRGTVLNGACIASSSEIRTAAMLILLMVG